jgi:hypothetical protein
MEIEDARMLELRLRPRTVCATLLGAMLLLWIPGATGALGSFSGGVERVLRQFNFDREGNLAAFWQGLTLLGLSLLGAVIAADARARGRGRETLEWAGVAGVFAFLAVDEATAIHEALVAPVLGATGASGVLHFAWLIPAFAVLAVLAGLYLGWYLRLPPRLRLLLTVALVLFLLGAVGGEMVGGVLYESGGEGSTSYRIEAQLEELLESLGAIVAVGALLGEIARRTPRILIAVEAAPQAEPRGRNRTARELESTRAPS